MYDFVLYIHICIFLVAASAFIFNLINNQIYDKIILKLIVPVLIGNCLFGIIYDFMYHYDDTNLTFRDYGFVRCGLLSLTLAVCSILNYRAAKKNMVQNKNDMLASDVPDYFIKYNTENIKPLNEVFESKRILFIKSFISKIKLSLIFLVIIGYLNYCHRDDLLYILIINFCAVLFFPGLVFWTFRILFIYDTEIKSNIYTKLFESLDKQVVYYPKGRFNARKVRDSGLIPFVVRQSSKDEICFTYNGVKVYVVWSMFSDFLSPYRRGGSAFQGIFIILQLNHQLNSKIIISKKIINNLNFVRLENNQFDGIFNVYANEPEQASIIITSEFLTQLLEINHLFNGDGIEASFYNKKLLLKIDRPLPLFHTNYIFEKCNFENDAMIILQNMQMIFYVIDKLLCVVV